MIIIIIILCVYSYLIFLLDAVKTSLIHKNTDHADINKLSKSLLKFYFLFEHAIGILSHAQLNEFYTSTLTKTDFNPASLVWQ